MFWARPGAPPFPRSEAAAGSKGEAQMITDKLDELINALRR